MVVVATAATLPAMAKAEVLGRASRVLLGGVQTHLTISLTLSLVARCGVVIALEAAAAATAVSSARVPNTRALDIHASRGAVRVVHF